MTVESQAYHKSCFKCSHGGCAITPSNYAALEGILYCKHHFSQLFKEKGSYNHLIKCASMKRTASPAPESWSHPEQYIDFFVFFFFCMVCFPILIVFLRGIGKACRPLILFVLVVRICMEQCVLLFIQCLWCVPFGETCVCYDHWSLHRLQWCLLLIFWLAQIARSSWIMNKCFFCYFVSVKCCTIGLS